VRRRDRDQLRGITQLLRRDLDLKMKPNVTSVLPNHGLTRSHPSLTKSSNKQEMHGRKKKPITVSFSA
jgi:hypothetical protein